MLILLNVGCDQATKRIAREKLQGQPPIELFQRTVVLAYVQNQGGFLSMFSQLSEPYRAILLVYLPLLFLAAGAVYLYATPSGSLLRIAAGATIIGGGLSNIVDRIRAGAVVDFVSFGIGSIRTGILNTADLSVTFGCAMLILAFRRS